MWKERMSETKITVLSITWGSVGGRELPSHHPPPVWKIFSAPFFKVHLKPDGDIIKGILSNKIFLMHHGDRSGSSLEGRHLEIDILPMNWKVPNQKVEMGRTCSPIWDRERNPAHHCGKKILGISPPAHPQTQRSNHLTTLAYNSHLADEQPLTDCWEGSASSNFQNILKQL